MNSYMLTKHEIHQCKECQEKLPNLMHIAKHQTNNESKTKNIQSEEESLEKKDHNEDDQLEQLEEELSSLKKELS